MRNVQTIIKKMNEYRKEYQKLEKKQLETQNYEKINEIEIAKHDIFFQYLMLVKKLREIDPDNPELQKGIHNLQYTGI